MNERDKQIDIDQSAAEIIADLENVAERLERISQAMASTILHSLQDRDGIVTATDRVLEHADTTLLHAQEIRVLEESFGDEESYWTVFRMFATEQNLGIVRSIEQIWDYLAKTYDLSGETPESVQSTILEWAEDIQTDAEERGIKGRFIEVEDGLTFAETVSSHVGRALYKAPELPVKTRSVPTQDNPSINTTQIVEEAPTIKTRLEQVEDIVLELLQNTSEDSLKQSTIKKVLTKRYEIGDAHHPQQMVDRIVERGAVFKYYRDKVAYLSLKPRDDEITLSDYGMHERKATIEQIESELNIAILQALSAPGTHFNQKLTLSELWRRINAVETKSHGSITDAEIERLKRACRQLQSMNLIVAGGEKMGTGGVKTNSATSSKRRRSATRQVFKVGFETQERKVEVQNLLKAEDTASLLTQRLTLSRTSEEVNR